MVKWSRFSPPNPIKATPTEIASNQDVARPATFSDADGIMLTLPSQSKDVHNDNSTPTASNPPEGKTTAVIAVMMSNPKDGYTCLCSNKHCKQRIMWVLLDSGSDSDLIFVSKDKQMLLLYSKSWLHSLGIFQKGSSRQGIKLGWS